jgi:hypothetical protein
VARFPCGFLALCKEKPEVGCVSKTAVELLITAKSNATLRLSNGTTHSRLEEVQNHLVDSIAARNKVTSGLEKLRLPVFKGLSHRYNMKEIGVN